MEPNLSFTRPDRVNEPLYVITPVFNPQRYRKRWKLYDNFERYVLNNNEAHLVTVECVFGNREEVIVEKKSDKHTVVHVFSRSEIWTKEALINLGISRLPQDWQYVAWIDADIQFNRPDWVGETIQQLQHYKIVQMFELSIDLDDKFMPYNMSTGFVRDHIHGVEPNDIYNKKGKRPNSYHTGYAWAARRQAISDLGGLIDWAILGSADNHMARCFVGLWENSVNPDVTDDYKMHLKIWQDRCTKYIDGNIGYVNGSLVHYFHGAKVNRRYKTRWQILVNNKFEPSHDLKKDWNGIWQLTERNPKLRDQIREYFRQRNEDDITNDIPGYF